MRLTKKLDELESQLTLNMAPVLSYFLRGLARDEIVALFERYGLSPSEELIDIYEWKNGVQYENVPTGKLRFGVQGVFYPLKESLEIYELSKEEFPMYFPLFSDDTYLVNLDRNSEGFGIVYIYCPPLQILTPKSCFDSITSMIDTQIACFAEGIYSYDDEDFFSEDIDRAFEISKKMNPLCEYWS